MGCSKKALVMSAWALPPASRGPTTRSAGPSRPVAYRSLPSPSPGSPLGSLTERDATSRGLAGLCPGRSRTVRLLDGLAVGNSATDLSGLELPKPADAVGWSAPTFNPAIDVVFGDPEVDRSLLRRVPTVRHGSSGDCHGQGVSRRIGGDRATRQGTSAGATIAGRPPSAALGLLRPREARRDGPTGTGCDARRR